MRWGVLEARAAERHRHVVTLSFARGF